MKLDTKKNNGTYTSESTPQSCPGTFASLDLVYDDWPVESEPRRELVRRFDEFLTAQSHPSPVEEYRTRIAS